MAIEIVSLALKIVSNSFITANQNVMKTNNSMSIYLKIG